MALEQSTVDFIMRELDERFADLETDIQRSFGVGLRVGAQRPPIERQGLEIAYGTVVAVSALNVQVTLDSDPLNPASMFAAVDVAVADRVICLLVPPSSGVVLGTLGGVGVGQARSHLEWLRTVVADQTSITTLTDLTGLVVDSWVPEARVYEFGFSLNILDSSAAATEEFRVVLEEDGTRIQQWNFPSARTASDPFTCGDVVFYAPTSDVHTYQLRGGRGGSAVGTFTLNAQDDLPAQFWIKDAGLTP